MSALAHGPDPAAYPGLLKLPLLARLTRFERLLGLAAGSALILAIATLQPRVTPDLPVSVLYVVPIVLVAWIGGTWPGAVAALAASIARLFTEYGTNGTLTYSAVPWWNFGVTFALYMITVVLLARLHSTLLYEHELARTDPLTMLGNRRFFQHVAELELSRSRRYRRPFALAYIDLDHFKEVNDRLGHAEGDRLLRLIARTLVAALRASDIVVRLGGDEFAVLLPETNPDGARVAMQKTHERLTAVMHEDGTNVTFSIGVSTYTAGAVKLHDLLDHADRLMYAAKKGGRDRVMTEEFGHTGVPA